MSQASDQNDACRGSRRAETRRRRSCQIVKEWSTSGSHASTSRPVRTPMRRVASKVAPAEGRRWFHRAQAGREGHDRANRWCRRTQRGGAATGPVAKAERGSVAGKPTESGRATHRTSRVRANGGERGAFLDGRSRAAGGATGEQRGVCGLQAVTIVAVLARDAVGELMKVGFACDHASGLAEPCGDPGVRRCILPVGRIKLRSAACRESSKVETIF